MKPGRLKNLLECNIKDGEKTKLSPVGDVIGVDGRSFRIDGDMVLSSLQKNGLDICLDENHSFAEAVGWFDKDSFEVKEDGIYAALSLTPKGKLLAENKSYRYLSPVYDMGEGRVVVGLDSVGFVNRPNLLNNAINEKEQILDEVKKLKEENEKLLEQNKKLLEELEALKAKETNTKDEKSDANDELKKLKEQNEKLSGEFEELKKVVSAFGKKEDLGENNETNTLSDEEKRVAGILGISDEEMLAQKGER